MYFYSLDWSPILSSTGNHYSGFSLLFSRKSLYASVLQNSKRKTKGRRIVNNVSVGSVDNRRPLELCVFHVTTITLTRSLSAKSIVNPLPSTPRNSASRHSGPVTATYGGLFVKWLRTEVTVATLTARHRMMDRPRFAVTFRCAIL